MDHIRPNIESDLDAAFLGLFSELHGFIVDQIEGPRLDKKRRQSVQVPIKRGDEGIFEIFSLTKFLSQASRP